MSEHILELSETRVREICEVTVRLNVLLAGDPTDIERAAGNLALRMFAAGAMRPCDDCVNQLADEFGIFDTRMMKKLALKFYLCVTETAGSA